MFGSQLPSASSQLGFENVVVDNIPVSGKRVRVNWSDKEDNLLISAWLNISQDSIVGNKSFWRRVWNYYDENRKDFCRRKLRHLQDHWHRLSPAVLKFDRCYEEIVQRQQSECSEKDIINAAHELYRNNYGSRFTSEHAWKLVKDEPKWRAETHEGYSKRTKVSESGAYTSSSNPDTPTSCEFDGSSPLSVCLIGQKAAKRNAEAKVSPPSVCLIGQKAAKRNVEAKVVEASSADVEASPMSQKATIRNMEAKVVEASGADVEARAMGQNAAIRNTEAKVVEASSANVEAGPMGQKAAIRTIEVKLLDNAEARAMNQKAARSKEAKVVEASSVNVEARPMDQKEARRNKDAKVVEASSVNVEAQLKKMQVTEERRLAPLEQLARAKEEVAQAKLELAQAKEESARAKVELALAKLLQVEYEILFKDTSGMTEAQRKDHEVICEFIRQKFKTM